jgi:uncharacterized membrane protein
MSCPRMSKNPKNSPPKNLPSQQQQSKQMGIQATAQSFSGPLPHPSILAEYDGIVPGAAERILTMAESQSQHRQNLERAVIESDIKNSRLGLHYGLLIGLTAVIGGTICIVSGYQIGGSIIGGTGLTGLVGVFVYGSRQRQREREARFKAEVTAPNR